MNKDFYSIGEVLTYLKSNSTSYIEERAKHIQDFIDKENMDIGYEYDRYMEQGASSFSNVVTECSKNKKKQFFFLQGLVQT